MSKQDPRFKNILGSRLAEDDIPSFVIIGCPVDEGVVRNGGRAGTSGAPSLIRTYLEKMTPPPQEDEAFIKLVSFGKDLGNIDSGTMEEMQQNLGDTVAPWLEKGVPVIILGGGHETSYGHYLGYRNAEISHHIINLDAHADVRPLKEGAGHSGSPFRQILDDSNSLCKSYQVIGLQPQATAVDHKRYMEDNSGQTYFKDVVDDILLRHVYSSRKGNLLTTFDMDALDQSEAPGVSAPCPDGLSKSLFLTATYIAGKNQDVRSMDLVEVNPEYDRDDQTVRLAALGVWNFLRGLSARPA